MKRDPLVIAGYYGFGNAGDELILLSLIRKFRSENPERPITILSADPASTARSFSVQAVNRWHPWSWIGPLVQADRFVLGGGGLLQETTGPWNHLYYLSLLVVARILGCETEVMAIGVDPIKNPWNRFLTRVVLNNFCSTIFVRDEPSKQTLIDCDIRQYISVVGDPVFDLLNVSSSPAVGGGGPIAFALSPWPGRPEWALELAKLCDGLKASLHVAIDLLVFFPAEDEALAREVSQHSSAIRSVRLWEAPEEVLAWLPEYRLVIATRFHALVLAAINQQPFIGWGTQNKVITLCQNNHMPFWAFTQGWQPDSRLEQIKNVVYNSRVRHDQVGKAPVL